MSVTLDTAADRAGFTVGGVIRRMTGVLRQNPGALLALAAVFSGVLPFLVNLAYERTVTAAAGPEDYVTGHPLQALILLPVTMALSLIFQGPFIHVAVSGERGWALGPSLRTALRLFFPNLGLYVLTNLAISAASLLLLVPGIMVACRYMVAIPAEVAERTGVSGALARSRDLTRDCRWRIFGLMLLFGVVYAALAVIDLLLAAAAYGAADFNLVPANATIVTTLVTSFIGTLGTTAIYLELRRVKEGGTVGEIASVFE